MITSKIIQIINLKYCKYDMYVQRRNFQLDALS